MRVLFAFATAAAALLAVPASAQTAQFNFSYSYFLGQTYTVDAVLTGIDQNDGSYLITGASGSRQVGRNAPSSITGIAGLGSINGNDNLLFLPSTTSFSAFFTPVDAMGIAFTENFGASPIDVFSGKGFALASLAQETFVRAGTTLTQPASGFSISVTPVLAAGAVPEPATWAMMVLGFGMVGFGLRRRAKQTVRVTYA